MSEIIAKAGKIACIAVVMAFILIALTSLTAVITQAVNAAGFGSLGLEITNALVAGRRIANNFIPATLFNVCIDFWLTGSAFLLANYAVTVIGGKIAGTR